MKKNNSTFDVYCVELSTYIISNVSNKLQDLKVFKLKVFHLPVGIRESENEDGSRLNVR